MPCVRLLLTARRRSLDRLSPTHCSLRVRRQLQPATHLPCPSNSIVRPDSASTTGLRSIPESSAVREPGRALPPTDAASLGCEMITVAGRISSFVI